MNRLTCRESAVDHAAELWDLWLSNRTDSVRNQLFEHYFPWCRKVASGLFLKYGHHLLDWNDFVSIASLATLKCIETYTPSVGAPFEGYAYARLRGSVLNEIRKNTKHSKTRVETDYVSAIRAIEETFPVTDSVNTIVDFAIEMAFAHLLEASSRTGQQPCTAYDNNQTEVLLKTLVDQLEEREKFIIKSAYFQQIPLNDIATVCGVSCARISQLHKSGLVNLRRLFENHC